MAITNYTTLKASILNWLNRNGFTELEDEVDNIIDFGQRRINRDTDLRTRHYRANDAVTIDDSIVTFTLTNTPNEIQSLSINGGDNGNNQELFPMALPAVTELQGQLGTPRYYSVLSQNGTALEISFAPAPNGDQTGRIFYYILDPSLTSGTTTNITVREFPSLLLYACLVEASIFLKDDNRIRTYEGRYALIKDAILKDEEKFGRPGGMGRGINLNLESGTGGYLP